MNDETIQQEVPPDQRASAAKEARERVDHRGQQHFIIRIQKVDQNSRNSVDPVPVGVNGVMYAIRRGKDALVPACVVEVLEHAIEIAYESEDNDAAKKTPREVQSYPFQVLKGPIAPEDVKKTKERMAREVAQKLAA